MEGPALEVHFLSSFRFCTEAQSSRKCFEKEQTDQFDHSKPLEVWITTNVL